MRGSDGAVVVFSGGQDSTTCLFWARERWKNGRLYALTFDYGQRHASEIAAAQEIAAHVADEHVVFPIREYGKLSQSALTKRMIPVSETGGLGGLPSTFTPGRNLVFLTIAASWAISMGLRNVVTGVCETDYSGYPDCRRETIDAVERAVALGNGLTSFFIHTPLMKLSKADTVRMAWGLGPKCMEAIGRSVTCYHGLRPGCGECPACLLRAKGFAEAGVADPARLP